MIRPALPCLVLLLGLTAARADDQNEPATRLPQYFVAGERIGALEISVPRADLRPAQPNLGQDLLAIPGVYGHARAADAMEPSIRGLGLDRVATTLNGIQLSNASPERTNSPVVILGPAAVTAITVTKALPSVTQGPVTTGGRISLSTADVDAAPGAEFNTTYDGARDGFTARGRANAAVGDWTAGLTFFRNDLGDYSSANGREVAARLDEQGASASLGVHTATHRIRAEALHRRLRLQETVSLPLDGKNTDTEAFTLNDRWTNPAGSALQSIEWRAGYSFTDPYITSELRKTPTLTFAEATARSFGAGVTSTWRAGDSGKLSAGADFSRQNRRAVRTTVAGRDFIWPDGWYEETGVFAEWSRPLTPAWRLRLGTRADEVRSDARDADQTALGRPIRQQFVTYNGAAAATTAKHDLVGAGNLLLEWTGSAQATAFVGAGVSAQPAQITERYRAFLNALGGDGRGGNAVELGNPALRSERKAALEAGGTLRRAWVDLEATAYYYRVDNFILRTPVGTTQPPLANMVVFGYRNRDAEFAGAELGATLKPAAGWTIPVTFARATGRDREAGVGLSEIPPWETNVALRQRSQVHGLPFAWEFGGRIVAAKTNPAPLDNPLFANAAGFSLWHLRAGASVTPHLRIEAGVENLFNRTYTEYLSPPTGPFRPATGNLVPGERVPGPRRSGWVSVTLTW